MTARHPQVHQVLATLGYGDAIGHEVLGIQRVLRSAGYDSRIQLLAPATLVDPRYARAALLLGPRLSACPFSPEELAPAPTGLHSDDAASFVPVRHP